MKWMDRPSATEMERRRASEMDRQTKYHTNENATKTNRILITFFRTGVNKVLFTSVAFSFLWRFVCLSISEARLFSISVALGLSIHFTGTSSIRNLKTCDPLPLSPPMNQERQDLWNGPLIEDTA